MKFTKRDYWNVFFYSMMMIAMLMFIQVMGYIPAFVPLTAVICPFVSGLWFRKFLSHDVKFGMTIMMGILIGLLDAFLGMGFIAMIFIPAVAMAADVIMKKGDYKDDKINRIAHGIFTLQYVLGLLPIVMARDVYYDALIEYGYGADYADAIMAMVPQWSLPLYMLASFLFGVLGYMVADRIIYGDFSGTARFFKKKK